jgi:FdhD protein
MREEPAAVEEVPVWLEINGHQAVTWMCTPDLLEELAVGWLHGEGFIDTVDDVRLRPCATDLGFWATVAEDRVARVAAEQRRPVLASGCGAVSTFLADPATAVRRPRRGPVPDLQRMRALFKEMFGRGERYRDTGGIHAAALVGEDGLRFHAEDIGRHNAVDKVIGAALLARQPVAGLGLLVTGRISAELAFKGRPTVNSTTAPINSRSTFVLLALGRRSRWRFWSSDRRRWWSGC